MVAGENHSLSILVSSSMYDTSFTSQRVAETQGDPHTYIIDAKVYDVKPQNYSKERFYVFLGTAEMDPFIIDSYQDVNSILDSLAIKRVDEMSVTEAVMHIPEKFQSRVITVPIDFINDFRQNLIQSIQDIAGEAVAGEGKLFNSKEHYNACVDNTIPRAFSKDEITVSTKLLTTPQDYILESWQPEQPEKKRYMHVDQSLSGDSTGLSCCYLDYITVEPDDTITLHVKYDWMLLIRPPKAPAKIDLAKVRSLIPWLTKNKGINWGMISYDTFQSAEAMQELEKAGFPVQYRSVDKTDEAYLTMIDYIYQDRVKFPQHDVFEEELFGVVHYRTRRKVDHLLDGHKDLSDSAVGSLMNLVEDDTLLSYMIQDDLEVFMTI